MSTKTPVPCTRTTSNDHSFGTLATDGTTAITEATIITIGTTTNTVGNFIKAGVMRKTAGGYSHAVENDPAMLSVHNLV